ncbi:MAG: ATP-binding cassette domain-containing protein [Oscillospiraceae bacterium]|jgi:ABC-type lipoprotein export system ATPase subunit|nr:ATP-binding cassette domain-containing protein [Oscillospiraceae bacterium]
MSGLKSITVFPGLDKEGRREAYDKIVLRPQEIYAVVGNTGSGKSRFISDIEQLAQGDTVTKRRVTADGGERLRNGEIAYLGQSMRFVLDCTVAEFIVLHARCYADEVGRDEVSRVLGAANGIASEEITGAARLGALSGGQSRALMIAGISVISHSSVVLIDEIENAGIDKVRALDLLISRDKLVLIVTHDPHTALLADRRIVVRNGAVAGVLETSAAEKASFEKINEAYSLIAKMQQQLRNGESLCNV